MDKVQFHTIDDYIASFPPEVQADLESMRCVVKSAVPGAEETISYNMPAFKHNGLVLYLSAFKNHYSVFVPSGPVIFEEFKSELTEYKTEKSTLQIRKGQRIPVELIEKLAARRAQMNTCRSGGGRPARTDRARRQ